MTKIHKDIAMHLMECVQDEEYSDQAVIKVGWLTSSSLFHPRTQDQSSKLVTMSTNIDTDTDENYITENTVTATMKLNISSNWNKTSE